MTKRAPKNIAASVRHRLQNLARQQQDEFQLVLSRYALERLLHRISQSPYRDRFIVKGAMLFHLWTDQPYRPTRDIDLLARGDHSIQYLENVFRDVCNQDVEFEFDGAIVARAIQATFERRRTPIPLVIPSALSAEFHGDVGKQKQWKAFISKGGLTTAVPEMLDLIASLRLFLMPPIEALRIRDAFRQMWKPPGPWRD